jgi:hypothetical protein
MGTIIFTRENNKPDFGTDRIEITLNGGETTEKFTVDGSATRTSATSATRLGCR